MSRYTTEVRFICETAAGLNKSKGGDDIESILTAAAPNVFNFDFPMYDENYRLPLERKILRHYYTREICAETVGLWKLWLNDKLNMIMPYYNQLYASADLEFNPFHDVDVTTEHTKENEGTSNGTTTTSETRTGTGTEVTDRDVDEGIDHTGTITDVGGGNIETKGSGTIQDSGSNVTSSDNSNDWKLFSDTPQGGIQGVAGASVIDNSNLANLAYLTTAENDIHSGGSSVQGQGSNLRTRNTSDKEIRDTTDTRTLNHSDDRDLAEDVTVTKNTSDTLAGQGTSQNAIANTEEFLEHVFGKRGYHTYSAMLMEYRKSLINIDAMIIEELEDLFFKLWD